MLAAYAELSDATDGAVNPLVGEALERLGYGPGTASGRRRVVRAAAGGEIVTWDAERLSLRTPATLDVGALGKGRLVDLVLALVESHAAGDIVVDASGDLAVRGAPVRIGLEHPYDPHARSAS